MVNIALFYFLHKLKTCLNQEYHYSLGFLNASITSACFEYGKYCLVKTVSNRLLSTQACYIAVSAN